MLASELYALSQGQRCSGSLECHWCAGPCERGRVHDDLPPIPFIRNNPISKRPANPFLCLGCWLWRRQRVTVTYLDGSWQDGRCAMRHSWWITGEGAWGIRGKEPGVKNEGDHELLYDFLLAPPLRFCLTLLEEGGGVLNHLQLAQANDLAEIKADTPLAFTLNNIPHAYTVYELKEALRHGPEGKSPGVQALVRYLGAYDLGEPKGGKKRGGRPPALEDAKTLSRIVRASGAAC